MVNVIRDMERWRKRWKGEGDGLVSALEEKTMVVMAAFGGGEGVGNGDNSFGGRGGNVIK